MTKLLFELIAFLFFSPDPTTEACGSVHGAGSCCRVVSTTVVEGSTPIERIVCG